MRTVEVVNLTDAHASEKGLYVARRKGSKAPYTDPPLAPKASGDEFTFKEQLAIRISSQILDAHLTNENIEPLRADSQEHFLADIKSAAEVLLKRNLTPLLLLPRFEAPEVAFVRNYLPHGIEQSEDR